MMAGQETHDVVVIGAGIIGINAALALQAAGRSVVMIDRASDSLSASEGNAGAFAFADIVPLATPGILAKAPGWLLDPLGPLSIRPSYAARLAPWMLRFWRASRRDRFDAALAAQGALMRLSQDALARQVRALGAEHLLQRGGQLQLFETEGAYRASLPVWRLREAHGVAFEMLESAGAIADIQPGLDPRFTRAGYTPDWINTCDPRRWLAHLLEAFRAGGGRIEAGEVTALVDMEDGVRLRTDAGTSATEILAKTVVVAAGAWSHRLARTLGDRIPLETERGYNTTLPEGAFRLRTHLTFSEHGFVVSRIGDGVRVGGAVEFGGLGLAPNYRRADALLGKAHRFLPGLDTSGGTRWMGFRPSLPDSLPVIDHAPGSPNVIYAFGHGHLGLTQAAGTAELVAALACHAAPPIPIRAFSARRFR